MDRQLDRIRRIRSSRRALGADALVCGCPSGPAGAVVGEPQGCRVLGLHAVDVDVHGQLGDVQVGEVHLLDGGIRGRPLVREAGPHTELEVPVLRVTTIVRGLGVEAPRSVGPTLVGELRELDELAVVHGLDEVRGPVEDHDGFLVDRSGLQRCPKGTGGAGVLDNEVHLESLDTLLVTLQPVHRATKEAALATRIRRGEHRSAVVERLPVRQTRADVLNVGRVPPVLTGLGVVRCRIDHTTRVDLLHEGHTKGAFPDLMDEVHVAFTHRGVHQRGIRRDVLHRVAGGLQDRTNGVDAGDLAGPVVDRQLDRIRRIRRSRRRRSSRRSRRSSRSGDITATRCVVAV